MLHQCRGRGKERDVGLGWAKKTKGKQKDTYGIDASASRLDRDAGACALRRER
jgi:hypothetical protein